MMATCMPMEIGRDDIPVIKDHKKNRELLLLLSVDAMVYLLVNFTCIKRVWS